MVVVQYCSQLQEEKFLKGLILIIIMEELLSCLEFRMFILKVEF